MRDLKKILKLIDRMDPSESVNTSTSINENTELTAMLKIAGLR